MAEILPAADDGREVETFQSWDNDLGETTTTVTTGTAADMDNFYFENLPVGFPSDPAGLTLRKSKGRGIVTVIEPPNKSLGISKGHQELLAVDVIMPIYRAAYFASVSTSEIAIARRMVDDGREDPAPDLTGTLAQQLFGHLLAGTTAYYETAYVLRKSYRVASGNLANVKVDDNNTVVTLPPLSKTLEGFIETLPAGEWLKRPTQIRYVGNSGWDINEEYQWAPSWSVVYGGTYTGGYS